MNQSISIFLERLDMARLLKAEDDIGKWADKEMREAKKIDDKRQKQLKRRIRR